MTSSSTASKDAPVPTYEELQRQNETLLREKKRLSLCVWLLCVFCPLAFGILYYFNWNLATERDKIAAMNETYSDQAKKEAIAAIKGPIGGENLEVLRKDAEELIKEPPPGVPAAGYAIRAYTNVLGRDFDAARTDLAEVRRIQPKEYAANMYYTKAIFAFSHMKRYDDATEEVERLLEDFPNEPYVLQVGAQYFSLTPVEGVLDMKRAQLLMERIVHSRPSGLMRGEMLLYAHTLAGDGKHTEALEAFKKGMALPSARSPEETEKENVKIQRLIEGLEKGTYKFPSISPLQLL